MHKSTTMPSLNVTARILSEILQIKKVVMFETHFLTLNQVMVIRLAMVILTFSPTIFTVNLMGIAWTVSKIIKLLFSWLRSVRPWMKAKVYIINTWCMLVSEAVTVLSLMMMTSIVSKEHTHVRMHARTDILGSSTLTFAKSLATLQTRRKKGTNERKTESKRM